MAGTLKISPWKVSVYCRSWFLLIVKCELRYPKNPLVVGQTGNNQSIDVVFSQLAWELDKDLWWDGKFLPPTCINGYFLESVLESICQLPQIGYILYFKTVGLLHLHAFVFVDLSNLLDMQLPIYFCSDKLFSAPQIRFVFGAYSFSRSSNVDWSPQRYTKKKQWCCTGKVVAVSS
jgi:hypothetical protein